MRGESNVQVVHAFSNLSARGLISKQRNAQTMNEADRTSEEVERGACPEPCRRACPEPCRRACPEPCRREQAGDLFPRGGTSPCLFKVYSKKDLTPSPVFGLSSQSTKHCSTKHDQQSTKHHAQSTPVQSTPVRGTKNASTTRRRLGN